MSERATFTQQPQAEGDQPRQWSARVDDQNTVAIELDGQVVAFGRWGPKADPSEPGAISDVRGSDAFEAAPGTAQVLEQLAAGLDLRRRDDHQVDD